MSCDEVIKTRAELVAWLTKTEMFEDSTLFKAFLPVADEIAEGQVLPEATFELWRLLKNTHLAGQYCKYGRLLLSFRTVHGWWQFQEACASGGVDASLCVGESEDELLALGYFDEAASKDGYLKFSVLNVTELPPVERMNQPQLGREVAVTLKDDRVFSASEMLSLFAEAGHDLVWRVYADGEKPADQVVMNIGHFLQFRNLIESDQYGMMTDCRGGKPGTLFYFSIWSDERAEIFRRAIADMLEKLDVAEIKSGNCIFTFEQYVRVCKEGTGYLSKIFPARDID